MSNATQIESVLTPEGSGGLLAIFLRSRWLMLALARMLTFIGKLRMKPFPFGTKIIAVVHHDQVVNALRRDADFLISPSYNEAMACTNGPFVLAMDRCPQLSAESHALYMALGQIDMKALSARAAKEGERLLECGGNGFDAVQDFIWPVCGYTAQFLFGLSHIDPSLFRHVARAIFFHVFYNAGNKSDVRDRAITAGKILGDWLDHEIARRRKAGPTQYGEDYMGQLLKMPGLDDNQIRRTMGGLLVGSVDTISGITSRILAQIDRDPKLRKRMMDVIDKKDIFNGYCLEAQRLWPQTPLISRTAANDTKLADYDVKAGKKLLLLTHAAMFDPKAFQSPTDFRPDRPMTSYLHYGGGVHACSGAAMSNLQVPMMVRKLLQRNYRTIGKMKWAGPFPNHLPIAFDRN